jgi:5'-3' exonuclease
MTNYILIDGSYFVFFRYHSLKQWWGFSHKDDSDSLPIDENPEFIQKFKDIFSDKIKEIAIKLKIKNPVYIVGKDCPRGDIWRNQFIQNYKAHRADASFMTNYFKMSYDSLFNDAGVKVILSYPGLEADDCIAITSKYLLNKENDCNIYIITSDLDYLQLYQERINIFTLKYKPLNESSCGSPDKDLFCKIVMGDKSDGIPAIFPKCGIKTAIKYYDDKETFEKKLNNSEEAKVLYSRNQKIIDFNFIPIELQEGFMNVINNIL